MSNRKRAPLGKGKGILVRMDQVARKFYWSVRYYGLDLTIVAGIVNLLSFLWKDLAPTNWHKRICSRRFDKRFAVDTAGHVTVEELDITNNQKEQAILYQPTAAVTFGLVLSELPINYGDYVFVDYGSGKGQALIMAAFFPFKRVVGVEISYKLHLIAQNNIKRFRARMVKCRNIISICEDATTFDLPEDPLVLYFFYPFKAEVLRAVINNIRRSLAQCFRPIIILYKYPQVSNPLWGMEFNNLLSSTDFLRKANMGFNDRRWEIYETLCGGRTM